MKWCISWTDTWLLTSILWTVFLTRNHRIRDFALPTSSMWHLAAVARSPALQAFLSADDQRRVDNVLHPTEDAAAPAELPAAVSAEADAAADDDSFPTSAHLERRVSCALRTLDMAYTDL